METYQVIKRILITEKSTIAREESNKYFFEVDRRANKVEIGKAVEKLFNVKVVDVRVMQVLGKKKRMGRLIGQKRSWKKAIVTLVAGNRIEIAEGV
ncbi:MAG TPA: 50S ribosomal protein L23 [Smithellaceae bacterium]|jgi:large subunit ribosomal protein L23|nr:50S ribosomal protein L23 [Smithellaceae bacterium]OPZ54178.1 MAG: 50S ribosomal protein L23 [Deltaproteobacteria bacterium ADurb.BinA014]HNQ17651.1 50S ribosomal protein L23 [Smithellaceae bacterium]HNT90355.1 50S ribosomal protein L23 [Smithellaceae bacterium]HNV63860.1 50S ribosomal protein L23 [Smithellaceae bacterium]